MLTKIKKYIDTHKIISFDIDGEKLISSCTCQGKSYLKMRIIGTEQPYWRYAK